VCAWKLESWSDRRGAGIGHPGHYTTLVHKKFGGDRSCACLCLETIWLGSNDHVVDCFYKKVCIMFRFGNRKIPCGSVLGSCNRASEEVGGRNLGSHDVFVQLMAVGETMGSFPVDEMEEECDEMRQMKDLMMSGQHKAKF
jgi:hypothetical protein